MKQALLLMLDGEISEHEAKEKIVKAFAGCPLRLRQMGFDPKNNDEVTWHIGRWVRFLANGEEIPEPSIPSEEQKQSLRKIMWQELKPLLKEVWYGPPKEAKPSASA